jgi:CBS-domain-containing membrane protein
MSANGQHAYHADFKLATLGSIVHQHHDLIYGDTTTTIEQATHLMKQHHIQSLPIWNNSKKTFDGIIDAFSVMFYLSFGKFKALLSQPAEPVFDPKAEYGRVPVSSLLGNASSETAPAWVFNSTDSIEAVLEAFSKGVHRALLRLPGKADTPASYRIVSQSDILTYINGHQHVGGLATMLQKPLIDLQLANPAGSSKSIVALSDNQTALDGFRKMFTHGMNAVPVVSHADGHLIANLSASDVRNVNVQEVRDVQRNIIPFLQEQHGGRITHPVTCTPHDSLLAVLQLMLSAKVHRVWIVDAACKPLGCVSATDIISKL